MRSKFMLSAAAVAPAMVSAAGIAAVVWAHQRGDLESRDFNPRTVLRRPIRPIVDAPFATAADAGEHVSSNDLVLGVVVGGQARAYPINMLTGPSREIFNDELAGQAIAATW